MAERQATTEELLSPRERITPRVSLWERVIPPVSPRKWVIPLALLWLVALVAGAVGIFRLAFEGHGATATSAYIPWGLWVAVYIFFVESAAGIHLASTLGTVYGWRPFTRILKLNLFLAFIFAGAGISLIWLDLGRRERIWEFYLRPNFGSPMNIMAWIYLAFMLLQASQLADLCGASVGRPAQRIF